MPRAEVKACILRDRAFNNWDTEVEGRWSFEDLRADPGYYHDWISFTSVLWDPSSDNIYCGLTALDADILYVYERRLRKFTSLGFNRFGDKFDVKVHRSLEMDDDGTLYLATALLHDADQQFEAEGGKLVKYDPITGQLELLAIPVPRHYIQSITLDKKNKIIYGITYPAEIIFRYDIETKTCRKIAYIGNSLMICQPHIGVVDGEGCFWATWGENRAFESAPGPNVIRLLKYDPKTDEITWFDHGLPKINEADRGVVDEMLLADDGFIYIGTGAGAFVRLDPKTSDVKLLGKPCPEKRLAGLALGKDGLIYGAGGDRGRARVFAYDREKESFIDFGPIYDPKMGESADRIHCITMTDDLVIYAGENDNHRRSSYLWECKIIK